MPTAAPKHGAERAPAPRHHVETRGNASDRGYDGRWQRARRGWLIAHPLCAHCEDEGKVCQGNVVDHIVPHRGDPTLFWDTGNWQTLCKTHHDRKTGSGE